MSTKEQNEKKFPNWRDLPSGGRRYWFDVLGRSGWRARYVKEADAHKATVRFHQEIYDEKDQLVEVHDKYPVELEHRKA